MVLAENEGIKMERYRGKWIKYNGEHMIVKSELTDNFYAPTKTTYKCQDGNFYYAENPAAEAINLILINKQDAPKLYEQY